MRRRNRTLATFALSLCLACGPIPRAAALVVTCTNCGTEWTQLANNLQLADQLARQVELVQEAIKQHQNMVLNTNGLDAFQFGNAMSEIKRVTALLGGARSLTYSASDLDAQFARKYKNYETYLRDGLDADGLRAKYQQWSEDTNSSVLTTLKGAGLQSEQIEGDEDRFFQELEGLTQSAEGRMQALQVGSQIALAAARQTQKLRQLILMQLQLQANFIQTQMDRRAAEDAAFDTFVKTGREEIKTRDGKGF